MNEKNSIIGHRNCGFDILEAEYVTPLRGICLGRSDTQYVTWYFRVDDSSTEVSSTEVSYYFGHYFAGTDAISQATAYADYHRRLADYYDETAVCLRS